jgi:hypothetical protein
MRIEIEVPKNKIYKPYVPKMFLTQLLICGKFVSSFETISWLKKNKKNFVFFVFHQKTRKVIILFFLIFGRTERDHYAPPYTKRPEEN